MYDSLRRFAGAVGPWELEPDDLVQEALARALRGGPLSRLDNPAAYLRRTMVNLSYNYMKRRDTSARATTRYSAGLTPGETAHYPSDLADLLSLDPTARAVVYLHDVQDYSFAEIGAALDTPESTCRQIASRARRQLRNELTEEAH